MKAKLVGAFIAGVVFTVLLVVVVNIVTPQVRAEGSTQTAGTVPTSDEASLSDIVGPLNQVATEIQDPGISEFYSKLVSEYGLVETSPQVTDSASSNPAEALPDIKAIQYAALTLPLQEAGAEIQDKDIASFYDKFVNDCGWTQPVPSEGTK